ncbi:MAG: phage portal protein [Tepidisphaeraceae bacterium]
MPWQLKSLNTPSLTEQSLSDALTRLASVHRPRFGRLWAYYKNPARVDCPHTDRPYRQAQEWGLPARITGIHAGSEPFTGQRAGTIQRKEIVIENDIAWRVDAMVDYLFGKPLNIRSSAADPNRRNTIDRLIHAILAHNGGILFLQQLALLGAVHGFVDVLVKLDPAAHADPLPAAHPGQRHDERPRTSPSLGRTPLAASHPVSADIPAGDQRAVELQAPPLGPAEAAAAATDAENTTPPAQDTQARQSPGAADASTDTGAATQPLESLIQQLARLIRFEIVQPSRALPLLSPADGRIVDAYVQSYDIPAPAKSTPQPPQPQTWIQRFLRSAETLLTPVSAKQSVGVVEIITPAAWQRYEDGNLIRQGENSLGEIPLVHIQNMAAPFEYSGGSDVEPLIPLQDELNTRLCDRAHRIALQSFKMYLAKGIENFHDMPVSPGRMWSTDNEQAEVQEFGGDANAPSEGQHIGDVREALDKVSGVSPVAAGAIKHRIGNLTSAAALRITLISLLARTDRKRTAYGAGIARLIDLALRWLDLLGIFRTTPDERAVEIHWPSPLPDNESEKLQESEIKLRLGVPQAVVLRELGY